jgi:hypothetical protein
MKKEHRQLTKEELKARLKQLEYEYGLAQEGLRSGKQKTFGAMASGLITLFVALFAFLRVGPASSAGHILSLSLEYWLVHW